MITRLLRIHTSELTSYIFYIEKMIYCVKMAWNYENRGCFDKTVRLCLIPVNKDLKILTSTMNGASERMPHFI